MTVNIRIRGSVPDDMALLETIYREAFPDEDLLPLVRALLPEERMTLSLVGTVDAQLAGHVIFTSCSVVGSTRQVALLGPLAVAPAWQGRAIGSTLVRTGLRRLQDDDVSQVFVLGNPAYYGRFGFVPESRVAPPYPLPPEWDGAWQSKVLCSTATPGRGELDLPRPWLRRALWVP